MYDRAPPPPPRACATDNEPAEYEEREPTQKRGEKYHH